MFKKIMALTILTVVMVLTTTKITTAGETYQPSNWEVEVGFGIGGPVGMIGAKMLTAQPATATIFTRLGSPKFVWARLEIDTVINHGVGANFLLDLIRTEKMTVHIIDPGVFWTPSKGESISLPELHRKVDLTLGAGIDFFPVGKWQKKVFKKTHFTVGMNWRTYLGKPIDTVLVYGNYSKIIFLENLKGGQLWIVSSLVW